ncbi:feruloyl esterase, partial [Phenoliferia sp. Uapishka_3]
MSRHLLLGASLLLSLVSARVVPPPQPRSHPVTCESLLEVATTLVPNITPYVAQDYPANTTFSTPYASPSYETPVPDLPAFCRFGAFIKTSSESKVLFYVELDYRGQCYLTKECCNQQIQFEVWLPLPEVWSGRFAMVGNGGDSGGVNYLDMGVPLSKYHFAVSSTDGGHNGTAYDGTWARNNTQTQIDFGHRAVHLTAVASKAIIKAYYSTSAKHNYWIGCSSGGKQGLKEVQTYPKDFDGVIAGAAAQWWTHLQGYSYRVNALVNAASSDGHLAEADYVTISSLVFKQCDHLDGLADGIITDPTKCKQCQREPNYLPYARQDQNHVRNVGTLDLGEQWRASFPGFEPGTESLYQFAFANPGVNFGPGPDFFEYQVLNKTTVGLFSANETELERLLKVADETDPGQTNAIDADIEPFLKRGKLITYVGLSDYVIPTGSSFLYYDRVRKALGRDPSDSYRFFPVPGMGHCTDGTAAFNFGAASQYDVSLGGTSQSSHFDRKHDMVLAMIDWVEKGVAPDEIIGSKYVDNDISSGVEFQRKLCPYPKQGVYIGGDANSASSFKCAYVK